MVSQIVALLIALDPQASTRKVDLTQESWKSRWPARDTTFELGFPLNANPDRRTFITVNVRDTTVTTWRVRKLIP